MRYYLFFFVYTLCNTVLYSQSKDEQFSVKLKTEIESAFAIFQKDDDRSKLKLFLDEKLEQIKAQNLPISKSWIYTSQYYFEFMLEENFQAAFKYLDTLNTFIPKLDPCSELSLIILNNQGAAYDKKGDYLSAINSYLSIFNNQSKCENQSFDYDVLHNIALAYSNLGDHLNAIKYYKKVIALDITASRKQIAEDLFAIGESYSEILQKKEAIKYYEQGVKQLTGNLKDAETKTKVKILLHLATDLISVGHLLRAKQLLNQAKLINLDEYQAFMFLHVEALILESEGMINQAGIIQELALEEVEEYLEDRPNELILADFQEKSADLEKNISSKKEKYLKALNIISTQESKVYLTDNINPLNITNKLKAMEIFYKLFKETDIKRNDKLFNKVLDVAELAFYEISSEESKAWHKNHINKTYEFILEYYFEKYSKSENKKYAELALEYSERSKSLLLEQALSTVRPKQTSGRMDSLFIQKKEKLNHFNQLQLGLKKAKTLKDSSMMHVLMNELMDIELHLSYIEKQLIKSKSEDTNYSDQRNVGKLSERSIDFVEYFYGDSTVFIFQKRNSDFLFDTLEITQSLEKKISQFYNIVSGVNKASVDEYLQIAHSLYNSLIPEKLVHGKTVVIIPDGPLCMLPFSALTSSATNTNNSFRDLDYLLKNNSIQYQNSLRNATTNNNIEKDLICFAPEYKNDQLLVNAKKELEAIDKHIKADLYLSNTATKQNFIEQVGAYRIIHIAAHALHDLDQPDNAKIVFSKEGKQAEDLYAFEIQNLTLNSELVVLSACQTGKGQIVSGEGTYSLARKFFIAGSNSVLNSIWNVDDQSSLLIMDSFYKHYKESHLAAKSLQKAKLKYLLQADNYTSHPQFWSGFLFIQNGHRIESSTSYMANIIAAFCFVGLLFLLFQVFKSRNNL